MHVDVKRKRCKGGQALADTPRKIKSEEIARLAGVSRSTVSRVINGYSNVPEATRKRVMEVIEKSGYYPSFSGRVLAGMHTRTLGFVCVAPGTIAGDIQFSAYYAHVIECAAQHGYLVLCCIVKNLSDEENVSWIKRIFMEDRVDAGVFIGVDNDEPVIEELIARGKIVGVFDHFHPERSELNRISVNYETNTGEKIINYLYGLGHTKISVISGGMNRYSYVTRHESFVNGMRKHGIEPRREWMYHYYGALDGGYEETKRMITHCKERPSVICAYNDCSAFTVYQALEELGLRVPEDISVIGIDGHEKGAMITPKLTSFAFDRKEIFYSLVSRVIAVVEGKPDVPRTEFFSSRLIERESCRRVV